MRNRPLQMTPIKSSNFVIRRHRDTTKKRIIIGFFVIVAAMVLCSALLFSPKEKNKKMYLSGIGFQVSEKSFFADTDVFTNIFFTKFPHLTIPKAKWNQKKLSFDEMIWDVESLLKQKYGKNPDDYMNFQPYADMANKPAEHLYWTGIKRLNAKGFISLPLNGNITIFAEEPNIGTIVILGKIDKMPYLTQDNPLTHLVEASWTTMTIKLNPTGPFWEKLHKMAEEYEMLTYQSVIDVSKQRFQTFLKSFQTEWPETDEIILISRGTVTPSQIHNWTDFWKAFQVKF